jgi:hypothetical protein
MLRSLRHTNHRRCRSSKDLRRSSAALQERPAEGSGNQWRRPGKPTKADAWQGNCAHGQWGTLRNPLVKVVEANGYGHGQQSCKWHSLSSWRVCVCLKAVGSTPQTKHHAQKRSFVDGRVVLLSSYEASKHFCHRNVPTAVQRGPSNQQPPCERHSCATASTPRDELWS